jgi:hypothetical protein
MPDFTENVYNNPAVLYREVLKDVQLRLLGKDAIIADANNPFMIGLETACQLSASGVQAATAPLEAFYKRRTQTAQDLFKHMSEFDYIGFYSYPATTPVAWILSKDQLLRYAVPYNDDYYLIIIPENTVLSLGQYTFGIYYPIHIKIGIKTKLVSVYYDTTQPNPLYPINDNQLEFLEYQYAGVNLIELKLPIFQFSQQSKTFDVAPNSGFVEVIDFSRKFYAIRAFHLLDGEWVSLKHSISAFNYDPYEPTIIFTPEIDRSKIVVEIPQIYFSNKQIGTKIKVVVYTTLGAIDVDISNIDSTNITVTFMAQEDNEIKTYADALNKTEICQIIPKSPRLLGGTNGYSFSELRQKVINNEFHGQQLITPNDIMLYFKDLGYIAELDKDDLTNRVYTVGGVIKDTTGDIIPGGYLSTRINKANIAQNSLLQAQYKTNGDIASLTILPNNVFGYDIDTGMATILNDTERTELLSLQQTDKVAFINNLNTTIYTRMPYHTQVWMDDKYPAAVSYDLISPSISSPEFLQDNVTAPESMLLLSKTIEHHFTGDDPSEWGYTIDFYIKLSTGLQELNKSRHILIGTTIETNKGSLWQRAVHVESLSIEGEYDVFRIYIRPKYTFTVNDHLVLHVDNKPASLSTIGTFATVTGIGAELPLTCTLTLGLAVSIEGLSDPQVTFGPTILSWPDEARARFKRLAAYKLKVTLGECLSNILLNKVDLVYTDRTYLTYQDTIYRTYDDHNFKRDASGKLVVIIRDAEPYTRIETPQLEILPDGNNTICPTLSLSDYTAETIYPTTKQVVLDKEYNVGDYLLDEQGNRVIKHKQGDPIYINGEPVLSDHSIDYVVTGLHLRLNDFYKEQTTNNGFLQSVSAFLQVQYGNIRAVAPRLLERTFLYFKPLRSLGYAKFKVDNNTVINHPLGIKIKLRFYMSEAASSNYALQRLIRRKTIEIVEDQLERGQLALANITKAILDQFPDHVKHIDIFGINGNLTTQTLRVLDNKVRLALARELKIDVNGSIIITKGLAIDFVKQNV